MKEEGSVKGVSFGSSRHQVTHLLFADDSIVFLEGTHNNMVMLKDILVKYEEASGQRVNLQKSSIFLGRAIKRQTRWNLRTHKAFSQRLLVSDI